MTKLLIHIITNLLVYKFITESFYNIFLNWMAVFGFGNHF